MCAIKVTLCSWKWNRNRRWQSKFEWKKMQTEAETAKFRNRNGLRQTELKEVTKRIDWMNHFIDAELSTNKLWLVKLWRQTDLKDMEYNLYARRCCANARYPPTTGDGGELFTVIILKPSLPSMIRTWWPTLPSVTCLLLPAFKSIMHVLFIPLTQCIVSDVRKRKVFLHW